MTIGADAITLARAQFAFTIGFHIVVIAVTIGLSSYLFVLEALWRWTGKRTYHDLFNYWLKPFATNVAVGTVSGVVLEFEFGTNWGAFSTRAGSVIGPLMDYEVVVAFFLEAGFLGIMLFGMKRVRPGLHLFSTTMVALGSLFSASWILAANSWMQTPAGYTRGPDGRFLPQDWWSIIFNPSFPYRFAHMVIAAYLATAFMVGAVGAWHLMADRRSQAARTMVSMALWMAALVAPVQLVAGDQHGENTLRYQPAKVAAMEGDFDTKAGQPLVLFGLPNMARERTDYAVAIPHLGSLILTHSWNGVVKGLKAWPREERPNAPIVFWAFRIMVGLGLLMAAVGLASLVLRFRKRLYSSEWLPRVMVAMAPAGFVAILCGWTVTEEGRQPYTIYGLMRTAESASPIALPGVATSLAAILAVYLVVFGVGFAYLLRLVSRPTRSEQEGLERDMTLRAAGLMPGPAQRHVAMEE